MEINYSHTRACMAGEIDSECPCKQPRPTIVMWPELHWRLDAINDRHAHVTVYDHGARAGTLMLDRRTWDLLARYDTRLSPPGPNAI
jgi:hypothetical protein